MKYLLILLTVILSVFNSLAPEARAQIQGVGNEGAHGGDAFVMEFVQIGYAIAQEMQRPQYKALMLKWNLTPEIFFESVQSVLVTSERNVILKIYHPKTGALLAEREVDAKNIPADEVKTEMNRIVMSRTRWESATIGRRVGIVLHEYFGILNVERDNYKASVEFKTLIQNTARRLTPVKIENIEGRCEFGPSLTDFRSCVEIRNSAAEECARAQALKICRINGIDSCKIEEIFNVEATGQKFVGYRGCEAVARVKTRK